MSMNVVDEIQLLLRYITRFKECRSLLTWTQTVYELKFTLASYNGCIKCFFVFGDEPKQEFCES